MDSMVNPKFQVIQNGFRQEESSGSEKTNPTNMPRTRSQTFVETLKELV
jgi:hypothetical protein